MTVKMICKCNDAFEDLLTVGKMYPVLAFGTNSYFVKTDNGEHKWLGACKFEMEKR